MFYFKKFASPLLFPLPLCLGLLLLGLFLLWFTRRQRAGRVVTSAGMLLLILLSYDPFANQLLGSLEGRYAPLGPAVATTSTTRADLAAVKWIVVLGGGHRYGEGVPATGLISDASLARLVEGVRLYRELPGRKLLLSGGGAPQESTDAEVMTKVALLLGVPAEDIVLETSSRDTEEQARLLQPMLGQDAFILVTTASHMPRSMALLAKVGLRPIPAACDFRVVAKTGLTPEKIYPGAGGLGKSERAFYEYLGLAWGACADVSEDLIVRTLSESARGELYACGWIAPARAAYILRVRQ